jgi:hypothetical protein
MNLEASTINVFLVCIISLQAWMIKEVFALKMDLKVMSQSCNRCPHHEKE